jgi:Protein of unknown function (DUF3108)
MQILGRVLFAFIMATTVVAQTAPSAPARPAALQMGAPTIGAASRIEANPSHHFPDNQTFVYNAEWRLWNAGTATLNVADEGASHKVDGSATSTGFAALLYTVLDRFESHFDDRTFCSERIYKHTEEGTRKRDTNILYDYRQRKAVLDEKNLKTNELKHQTEDIPACVTDVLSGIFYVGSLPLLPNGVYTFPMNDGGKTVDVKATVEGKEQVKTTAGTYNTIRVRTEADTGPLKKRGSIWLWYSDDGSRIPVQMRARAFWGTLNLQLNRVESKK